MDVLVHRQVHGLPLWWHRQRRFVEWAVVWGKIDCLGCSFRARLGDVDAVAPVVLRGATETPAVDAVGDPSASMIGCIVHKHFGAGRSKWGAVEVESSVELCFGGQAWVDSRGSEQVQR